MRRIVSFIADREVLLLWVYGVPLLVSSSLPLTWLFASLATIPLFWLSRWLARGYLSRQTPLDLPLALLLGMGLVGLWASADLTASLRVFAELVGGIALFYGLVNGIQKKEQPKWAVGILLALGFVLALAGLVGTQWSSKYPAIGFLYRLLPQLDVSRFNPRGFTPNIVAGAVAPVLPVLWALVVFGRHKWRWVFLALSFVPALVLLLTQSRGAWVGASCSVLFLAVWRWPRLLWGLPIVALILAGAAYVAGPTTVADFLLASDTTGSAAGRFELWSRAIYMLQDFPFTGIGLGTFSRVVNVLYPLFLIGPDADVPHAHNLYLQMGVDYGVPGFVAFIALVTIVLGLGLRTIVRTRHRAEEALAIGLLAGYLVYLVHGFMDAVTFSTKPAIIVWMIAGIIVASERMTANAHARSEVGVQN